MALPLKIRPTEPGGSEQQGQTRDVSFRGLYFLVEADYTPGTEIELILRVETHNSRRGVAARIDRYEFLPATA